MISDHRLVEVSTDSFEVNTLIQLVVHTFSIVILPFIE